MPQDAEQSPTPPTTPPTTRPPAVPLLSLRGLHVAFGGGTSPVLHGVDLDVMPGERVAVVGQSGSGKSTIVGALLGLLPGDGAITGGQVLFRDPADGTTTDLAGADDATLRALRGRRIALVPQDPASNLNPSMTVGAQIADGLRAHGGRDRGEVARRVVELMTEAGIPDAEHRSRQFPHEFSGGMRQRVLIAIALSRDPALLVADEPTSALDATVQRKILDHLQTLVDAHGTSLLLITHDLGVAADRTDRIVVVHEGRVVEVGTPRQVLLDPQHEYTKRLVAAAPTAGPSLAPPAPLPAGPTTGASTGASAEPPRGPARTSPRGAPIEAGLQRPARTPDILVVEDLVKEFRVRGRRGSVLRAVDGVSFQVARGSTTAVVGESGSGKTTVSRIVLGVETATSGTALIDGRSITASRGRARQALRRRVQPVFQDPYASLDPTSSIERLVDEPLRIARSGDRASRQARVAELLDQVALPRTIAQRRPNELSGGQRQRVAIARALALAPDLLLCDEAVSALDVLVQQQVLALLADLQRDLGLSYLFITHDLSVMREIADHVVVMQTGKIVEQGSVDEVFLTPRSAYTRELLGAIPGAAFV